MSDQQDSKITEALGRFIAAEQRLESARRDLTHAECVRDNTRNELGKRMVPKDAKPDEVFHFHANGGILAICRTSNGDHQISWRVPATKQ